ncbi:ligase-associated DNA damage response endonuclease PdeM [Nisaea acidiphila]|uniref:Ligase-associated DNA damage response endonuclease PdeM n=1 Tax=Nisaea acidiphila TaxID=1862145 RepID=A0A9J7AR86_9PROT|nr:ligase-associated DNA damage response endonuclease PdeM [Nisaea acidiphila]UUX49759.1 ligase-associated DNA damage response endonuclease PdeM [Nisaea acidiphila]
MSTEQFILNGVTLTADPAGVLFWPERALLVVSDLHLEKSSSFAARGILLPPYDTAETLKRLTRLCDRYRPERVICLGDNFHDTGGPERMADGDRDKVAMLVAERDWCWITGNHDPDLPDDLPGRHCVEETVGALTFRHESTGGDGEVSGHFHPSARVKTRQRHLSGRCFAHNGQRLIMPAFGALTGGLSVRSPAIRAVLGKNFEILFLGPRRIYRFPSTNVD